MRELAYNQAINEALHQAMGLDEDVMVVGQLVDYRSGIFGTTTGLLEEYGSERVQDFPVAESLMTQAAIGEAQMGMRPVLTHQRLDFMIYSMDAVANWMSLWRFKSNGKQSLPITIMGVVGRGWGQGPQHSKSFHGWFSHLPGIKVAMPATPFDAKGMMMESVFGEDPVIFVAHRSLFSMREHVPEMPYRVRFGEAMLRRPGKDVSIVALGIMVPLAMQAAELLAGEGIEAEVLDLRSASPLDKEAILATAQRTKRLVVADPAWQTAGVAAEVISLVSEHMGADLAANPARLCLPDSHTPMSQTLEEQYYPTEQDLADLCKKML
ncbi:MAG: hypothetical protein K9K69_11235 [Desulfarculaceae bacterium]|nr:hypothetical protein [Desulfarculaceae bacterium]MCF8072952.1 hypothetical protein [Desulfarculaceae bacterium]MCF8115493.1 hypothetical protein [Desulfarculaceae bacterium]